jgi:YVTN family beta-propeller protein
VGAVALTTGLVFAGVVTAFVALTSDPSESDAIATGDSSFDATASTASPSTPSTARTLHLVRTVTGDIAPKSVVASRTGLVTAQNMMYRHSVTLYDADGNLQATIPDSVELSKFGISGHAGMSRGAPVEAAFTPDHRHLYVTNYSMYGAGFGPEGDDSCDASQRFDDSFVYRIDVASKVIDQVIPVGAVPKYVEVTPNGQYVLVTNWCSYDLTVIDTAAGRAVARVRLGVYPRGVAVDPTSTTAYVAVMGDNVIARFDLATKTVTGTWDVGQAPRHVVMDPSGSFLYVTLSGDNEVVKLDVRTGAVVATARTGLTPRSMAMHPDGLSLYVVNYDSSTITKVATADFAVLQTLETNEHPIGITYEPTRGRVWVAGYAGSLQLYDDV